VYRGESALFEIERGFLFDGASTPWFVWPLLPPFGVYLDAAILHDWLYRYAPTYGINADGEWCYSRGDSDVWAGTRMENRRITRDDADGLFRRAMGEDAVADWQRWACYRGVRLGGRRAWNKHRRNKRASTDPANR